MKFATLAMVASVSASTVLTLDSGACPTTGTWYKANEKLASACNATSTTANACKKANDSLLTSSAKEVTSTSKTLDDCYTTNKATTATEKTAANKDKCESDWDLYVAASNSNYDAKCYKDLLESTAGSTGALIGIIVGVVCCLGLTAGGVWYFCKHKKEDSAGMYNDDDLYEAFCDTETA